MTPGLAPEAQALVASAIARWGAPPAHPVAPLVPIDRLRAIAVECNVLPTGTGRLDGLTMAIKDNVAVADLPMAIGSGLAAFIPACDATLVQRARAAGARIVAKSQCEAFLLGANSFSSRPHVVRNPHDTRRSAGGSSSGSAALLAAGQVDLAIGSDTGGSIRIPASFCGVVGFKPSRGRVPFTGATSIEPTLDHVGPMARNLADLGKLFGVVDSPDGIDPRQAWACRGDCATPAGLRPLRIGVFDAGMGLADAAVAGPIAASLDRLERLGWTRAAVRWPDFDETNELHMLLYAIGRASRWDNRSAPVGFVRTDPDGYANWWARLGEDDLPRELLGEIAAGRELLRRDPSVYRRILARAEELAAALDTRFDDIDVLALPTVATPPPLLPSGEIGAELRYGDTRLTAAFNATGHPALSLPAGMADGLPVGLQLVGRRGADEALLAAAAFIECALEPLPSPTTGFGDRL